MLLFLSACGAGPGELPPLEREAVVSATGSSETEAADADPCARPATGCPCTSEGESISCGTVRERFGDYVRCTPGYRDCQNGAWGPCSTDRIVGPN